MLDGGKACRQAAAGLALTAALLMAACSGYVSRIGPTDSATPRPARVVVRQSVDTTASRDAGIIGSALQFSMLAPTSFSWEPKGDVKSDGVTRVYAHIGRVSASPASITFDAGQLFVGESAVSAAKRDHQELGDSQVYERDAYRHSQTASIVASTGVVLQFPREDVDRGYGPDGFAQVTATSFEDFARRFSSGDESDRLRHAGYWIVLDSDGVRSIAEQYQP